MKSLGALTEAVVSQIVRVTRTFTLLPRAGIIQREGVSFDLVCKLPSLLVFRPAAAAARQRRHESPSAEFPASQPNVLVVRPWLEPPLNRLPRPLRLANLVHRSLRATKVRYRRDGQRRRDLPFRSFLAC